MTATTKDLLGCHYKVLSLNICYTYYNIKIQVLLQVNKNQVTFIFGRNLCIAQLLQLSIST